MPNSNISDEILNKINPLFSTIDQDIDNLNHLTIEISEIAAPPFNEMKRANFIRKKFEELDYVTEIDEIGNVIAHRKNINFDKMIILSAHLDTVFPENTVVKVRKEKDILYGPGIGDDSRGLAVLVSLAKYIRTLKLKIPLVFIATVGEEGIGDLRGVKYIFQSMEHSMKFNKDSVLSFITIDGTGSSRVVHKGVGSKRFRIHFHGPGGHSYGAFGTVNPTYPLAESITNLSKLSVSSNPKTTYSVGIIGGGTSINAIPGHVWFDLDMRSEDGNLLFELEEEVKKIIEQSIINENSRRDGKIEVKYDLVGNRPTGVTEINSELVQNIILVNDYMDIKSDLVASSTDANVPMNLDIPAICVSGIETAGRSHSLEEYIDAGSSSLIPVKRNLLFLALLCM